jgi:hypothetical protein
MIYLIHCKNFYKRHNVLPPSIAIKNFYKQKNPKKPDYKSFYCAFYRGAMGKRKDSTERNKGCIIRST